MNVIKDVTLEPNHRFNACFNKKLTKHSFFYHLDCQSGQGLINPLLIELRKISSEEFEYYLFFFLKKCININQSFSDAIEFLSIWAEKSPDNLLKQLKKVKLLRDKKKELEKLDNKLKNEKNFFKKIKTVKLIKKLEETSLTNFFNRTEYDYEGDQWCFPKLLQVFSGLLEKKSVTANKILDYLFEIFDFFSMPEIFVGVIIGYDRLELCIKESPSVFKQALVSKVYEFVEFNKNSDIDINIGSQSWKYLKNEIREDLVSYVKEHLFTYSIKTIKYADQPGHYTSLPSQPTTCSMRV